MLHDFEIGCDGRNSSDSSAGGIAGHVAQPDSAANWLVHTVMGSLLLGRFDLEGQD